MPQPVSIILGPTYGPDLWDLRKRISADRKAKAGITFAQVRAPINSEVIDLALRSDSLYLIGLRPTGGQWLEFMDDSNSAGMKGAPPPPSGPRLPSSRWVRSGQGRALSSYRALRLVTAQKAEADRGREYGFSGLPAQLIGALARWDGALNGQPERCKSGRTAHCGAAPEG